MNGNIDVLIIAHNEALNLGHCLESLQGWVRKIHVIDSGSTDGTQELAQSMGAEVVHHDWEGYARQRNWALQHLDFSAPWTLVLDADESITPKLREELISIAEQSSEKVTENGYYINRLTWFIGKPIRHCGYFPSYHLRFFKSGLGRYEEREVHEHVELNGPIGRIDTPMLHDDRRGLEHYVAKHNRYSTLEARALARELAEPVKESSALEPAARRRRWAKRNILPRVPSPGLLRFLYMYVFRMGFLDGSAGFHFCRFIGSYDDFVAMKLRAIRAGQDPAPSWAGRGGWKSGQLVGDSDRGGDAPIPPAPTPETPVVAASSPESSSPTRQMQPESSPWTFREKLGRAAWMIFGRPLFRATFHNWYGIRRWILRRFGAKVAPGVSIRPSAHIEVPWMIDLREGVTIGDYAILYSLGPITIGERSIISQYAHLCAGTHDYADHTFKLIRTPIHINQDVWIGADAFVGPGVEVGPLAVLGARSSAYKNLAAGRIHVGNPARDLKERTLK